MSSFQAFGLNILVGFLFMVQSASAFTIRGTKDANFVISWEVKYRATKDSFWCKNRSLELQGGMTVVGLFPVSNLKEPSKSETFPVGQTEYEFEVADRSQEFCQYKITRLHWNIQNPSRGITSYTSSTTEFFDLIPSAQGAVEIYCEQYRAFDPFYHCTHQYQPWTGNRIVLDPRINFLAEAPRERYYPLTPHARIGAPHSQMLEFLYNEERKGASSQFVSLVYLNEKRVGWKSKGIVRCSFETCFFIFGDQKFTLTEDHYSSGQSHFIQATMNRLKELLPGSTAHEIEADFHFDYYTDNNTYSWAENAREVKFEKVQP